MLNADHISHLKRVGCFSIGTFDPWKIHERADGERDACRRFVAPLVAAATHARLYPSRGFAPELRESSSFLIPRRGYFEFDLRQECVLGHEEFWRAGAVAGEYARGSIVVVCSPSTRVDPLLKECVLYGVPGSRYQILKGSSAAAVRFAENQSHDGQRSYLFSASNGVEAVDIFSPETLLIQDYILAAQSANKPGWNVTDS